mmetsp:Transcript_8942/g.26853  ORF Transcript_8942/g.26853 Transcript_8942/m.26853 type:complete len:399 (-) Transcript_8942:70-1266(-)
MNFSRRALESSLCAGFVVSLPAQIRVGGCRFLQRRSTFADVWDQQVSRTRNRIKEKTRQLDVAAARKNLDGEEGASRRDRKESDFRQGGQSQRRSKQEGFSSKNAAARREAEERFSEHEKRKRREESKRIQKSWDPKKAQIDLTASERLSKVISRCGVASRRKADELIKAGKVVVNEKTIMEPGHKINPFEDEVVVDGKRAELLGHTTWIMFNKPRNVISTAKDEKGRKSVVDVVDHMASSLVPIGRLDRDSTGLLILTNDYPWVHKLSHPSFEHIKEYTVTARGRVTEATAERLRNGVYLPGEEDKRKTSPALVKIMERTKFRGEEATILLMSIREGRNHQIKRMLLAVDHDVMALHRFAFAGLRISNLKVGNARELTLGEINMVKRTHKAPPQPRN